MTKKSSTIRVLVCRTDQEPVVKEVPDTLDAMQAIVGGYIECVPLGEGVNLWCNEEGMITGLPPNRAFAAQATEIPEGVDVVITLGPELAKPGEMGTHVIHGDFFIAGQDSAGESTSLTDDEIARYSKKFKLARSAVKSGAA